MSWVKRTGEARHLRAFIFIDARWIERPQSQHHCINPGLTTSLFVLFYLARFFEPQSAGRGQFLKSQLSGHGVK